MSFGVLLQLTLRGKKVPEEIVVASYGEIEAAQLLPSSKIISIKQSPYEMGVRVGEILLKRLNGNTKEYFNEKFMPVLTIGTEIQQQ